MQETHGSASYKTYWTAWFILLIVTAVMLFASQPGLLLLGMLFKAAIITFWFMHLRWERRDFTIWIIVTILGMSLILFGLIVPDALAS